MTSPHAIRRLTGFGSRRLIVLVAAAGLALVAAGAVRASIVDAETRVLLRAAIAEEHAALDRIAVIGAGATTAQRAAATCITRLSERLAEVADGEPKMPYGSVELAAEVVATEARATRSREFVDFRPTLPAADGGVDELRAAAAELEHARQRAVRSVDAVTDGALDGGAECTRARSVWRAFVDGVRIRTDELLVANPKASAETRAAMQAAQVAVALGDAGAATRWATAVVATEASQAAAVKAEADAAIVAEAARKAAAQRSNESDWPYGGFKLIDPKTFLAECQVSPVCNPTGRKLE